MIVGVDVGGTFTDFVVMEAGEIRIHKVPSTPADPSRAFLAGLAELGPAAPERIVHGSTVATNALLERKGAVTAFLVTEGFRDLLEIGRQTRVGLYSLSPTKPRPLVPRERCFEIPERVDKTGRVLTPLDEEAARGALDAAVAAGAESVAVLFLFSFVRPEHERRVRDLAAQRGLYVSASCDILPEYREYERASTTTINAFVGPVMTRYLARLAAALDAEGGLDPLRGYPVGRSGVQAGSTRFAGTPSGVQEAVNEASPSDVSRETPDGVPAKRVEPARTPERLNARPILQIMQSNGGVISAETAGREAVRTILSGPAGGVVGAARVARAAGLERIVAFDMGGTSTDVSLVQGEPRTTSEGQVAGLPVRVPMLDIHTVGAGGGSIARVDAGGGLRVGPESAGADPGPAAYGIAELPTVTDANLALGRLHAASFLGGRMTLYPERAVAAIGRLAAELGLEAGVGGWGLGVGNDPPSPTPDPRPPTPAVLAAAGVIRVANAQMARAIRRVSVERGHDVREFCLVAFGGGGPLHACELAEAVGMRAVLVPRFPGTLSALGLLLSAIRKEYSHTVMAATAGFVSAEAAALFEAMEERARIDLAVEGMPPEAMQLTRWLDMRYRGQSYELTVAAGDLEAEAFTHAFHEAHRAAYGHANPREPTEVVLLRLTAVGETQGVQGATGRPGRRGDGARERNMPFRPVAPSRQSPRRPQSAPQPFATQPVYWQEWRETPLFARGELLPGHVLTGPALITQEDSTTLIAPGWSGRVDEAQNLLLERR